jgi:environmental stress-induced protein Ves
MARRPSPRCTLLRMADQRVVPWRNGSGVTREVAIDPVGATTDAFRWRVSMAEVHSAGPFSHFPGIDRSLWLLAGKGMLLDVDGREVRLDRPLQRLDFAGETPVHARLLDGPVQDLNVMHDRAQIAARAEIVQPAGSFRRMVPKGAPWLLLVLRGPVSVHAGDGTFNLEDGCALRGEPSSAELPIVAAADAPTALLLASFAPRRD